MMNKTVNILEKLDDAEKEELFALLRKNGDADRRVAIEAQYELAEAIQTPIRSAVVEGDIASAIFEKEYLIGGAEAQYPIDLLSDDNINDFKAFGIPSQGMIPQRLVGGSEVTINTYQVGNDISLLLKWVRDARWPIVSRAIELFQAGFVMKDNDDAWATILKAGAARGLVAYDPAATQGQFTKELVAAMQTLLRRNLSGNSNSLRKGRLTDLFVSVEAKQDMRSWDASDVDDITRREIYVQNDGTMTNIFGVNIIDLDELGVGQEYQNYYINVAGGQMAASGAGHAHNDVEIVVGLDLSSTDSFVNPIREEVVVTPDEWVHRRGQWSIYGRKEHGYAVLDNRRVLIGSL